MAGTAADGLDLDLTLAPLHLEDVGPFLPPQIPDSLRVQAEGTLRGAADTVHVRFAASTNVPGRVTVDGRVWGPRTAPNLSGMAQVASLDLQAWGVVPRALVLDGTLETELAGASIDGMGGTHGTLRAEARVDESGGSLAGSARLDASADSTGAPWRGQWRVAGLGLDAEGRATLALTDQPEWSLDGVLAYLRPERGDSDADEAAAFPLMAAATRVEASGRGFTPDSLTGRLQARIDSVLVSTGDSPARPTPIGPGTLTAEARLGELSVQLGVDAGGGRVELDLDGNALSRTVRSLRGSIQDVDVASLAGDTLPSRVRAELSGDMGALEPLRASGMLRVLHAEYGPWVLDSARVSADARADQISLSLSAALPDSGQINAGGSLTLEGSALREAQLDSLGWSHLNVRVLAAVPDSSTVPATDLSGHGQGRAALDEDGWSGSLALRIAPSTVGPTPVEDGAADIRLSPDSTDLSLALTAGESRVEANARIHGPASNPEAATFDLHFAELDLSSLGTGDALVTRLTGSASGNLTGMTAEDAVGAARLDMGRSTVGTTQLDTAHVEVAIDSGRVRTEVRADGLGAVLRLEGEGGLDAALPTYSVRGSLERPAPEDDAGLALLAHFGLDGEGIQPDSTDAELWIEIDSARWAGRAIERGALRGALSEGSIRLDTLSLGLPGAELSAGGRLPLASGRGSPGELSMSASVTRADLFAGLLENGLLAIGEADVDVFARGAVDDLRLEGTGRVSALLFNDIRVQGVEVSGEGHRTAVDGWVSGEGHIEIDRMRLPTAPVQSVRMDAALEPGEELTLTASAVIDGRRDVELTARLEQAAAPSVVRLERFTFRADQDRWTLAHPSRITIGDGFQVDSLRLAANGQTMSLRGGLAADGPLDLQADVEAFEISTVADLMGYPDLRGPVTGSLDVTGTAEAPVLDARLESRLEPRGVPPAALNVSLAYEAGTADLEGSVRLDDGPSLRAAASIPFEVDFTAPSPGLLDDRPMRASLAADSFPILWFEPFVAETGAHDLAGYLEGTAEMEGSAGDPSFGGELTLEGGAVSLADLGVRYREARAHVTFRGTDIVIDSLRVRSGDGTLSTSGTVTVERFDQPGYDLSVTADRFAVMGSSAIQATISGRVDVGGEGMTPEISGRVDVERADLYLEDLMSGSNVDAVTLTDEQWEELARVFGYQRPTERDERSPLMESITLDLDVRLGRASWVRQRGNPELALQFTGEMSVQKEPGDSLQLVGSVEAVPDRSWVEQFGRRFSIEEGQLTFQGTPGATRVQVRAEYDVPSRDNPGTPEVVLALDVSGTPDSLSVELSSTPPLDASDMVAYLVTGRPASQSLSGGGEGSLTDAGGALALGRLSGAVEAYAREEVGLDVVEITSDGLDGLTLLAGRYISPELYLGIRQPVALQGSSEAPTQRAPNTEIELEFQAVRWLLMNIRAGGRRGVEFFVRSRIAYD